MIGTKIEATTINTRSYISPILEQGDRIKAAIARWKRLQVLLKARPNLSDENIVETSVTLKKGVYYHC